MCNALKRDNQGRIIIVIQLGAVLNRKWSDNGRSKIAKTKIDQIRQGHEQNMMAPSSSCMQCVEIDSKNQVG